MIDKVTNIIYMKVVAPMLLSIGATLATYGSLKYLSLMEFNLVTTANI